MDKEDEICEFIIEDREEKMIIKKIKSSLKPNKVLVIIRILLEFFIIKENGK